MTHFQTIADQGQPVGLPRLQYRLALDLGTTSLGWAMLRLDADGNPCAIIRAGVRIFSNGREPKTGESLAVARRLARGARRRRDRLLRRKNRMMHLLTTLGFFQSDQPSRKAMERLDPYPLRAKGLSEALSGPEFARALFHLNQRRGFKSNRRTDASDSDSGALKQAISRLRLALDPSGTDGKPRTVGELLHQRKIAGLTVRARYRTARQTRPDGRVRIDKSYDLYIDRAMVAAEFDAVWAAQAERTPMLYTDAARDALRDCLLYQRDLRPVRPGRCTLLPDEDRAPLALPTVQQFRIYQEVNNLRVVRDDLSEEILSREARDAVVAALERHAKRTFTQIRALLGLPGTTRFNLEDAKRKDLNGNATGAALARKTAFGERWHRFDADTQNDIVERLLTEEDEERLAAWLHTTTGVDASVASDIVGTKLPDGYGRLSRAALARILPALRDSVISYADAAKAAGFHHSVLTQNEAIPGQTFELEGVNVVTGEVRTWHVFTSLPYYGEVLQRHVAFGTGREDHTPEQRFGRIANPTVHVGLNQVRKVVNALLARYGHPRDVVVEVARDLKQSREEREVEQGRQAEQQRRNERLTTEAATVLGSRTPVTRADLHKLILWEELSPDVLERRCPYSGQQIGLRAALSDEVEVDHILPFSRTLDDGLNNKTLAFRAANRIKGNRTPWEARADFEAQGWPYDGVIERASRMPRTKRSRFSEDGYARWLRDDRDFVARSLNDTRYLSRVAREYMSLVCPQNTRVIPGRMTAMLRGRFGLNDVLGLAGKKNRNDHRHHAVDACVIGVTDHGLLQRFAQASQRAREQRLTRLVDAMPLPWPTYRAHVERAVAHIWVSHKPDHSHEGAMHNDTAYGLLGESRVRHHKLVEGVRVLVEERLDVIAMTDPSQAGRHGVHADGSLRAYKGYKGDSNFGIEIVRNDKGQWKGEVITTFEAYQIVRAARDASVLRRRSVSVTGKPLVMRLMIGDTVRLELDGITETMRVAGVKSVGQIALAPVHEANVDARNRAKEDGFRYTFKSAGSLHSARGRVVTISPTGELSDPGFKD